MRSTLLLRTSALCSLLGLSSAQSSTWAQSQPFDVAVSTESLLGSSQQPLTNVVASSTPGTTAALAPVATVTGEFSTTIPTELVTASGSAGAGSSVIITRSGGSASASASASSRASVSASASSAASRPSSSGTGAVVQSTGAAAALNSQQKMMGVAGALAGAAGVLFV